LSNKFIVYLDQDELDRFHYQFGLDDLDDYAVDNSNHINIKNIQLSKIKEVMKYLPHREFDILSLYFFKGKDQRDIGRIFNLTQGDISYRIKRAIERIKFIIQLPKVSKRKMYNDLWLILPSKLHVVIMIGIYETTSQSIVAKLVGLSQAKVRHQFLYCLKTLKSAADKFPKFKIYLEIFETINKNNFNKMRELQVQERWSGKYVQTIL